MSKMIEQLNQEWKVLRTKLEDERIKFDEQYRTTHQNHKCSTKVCAWNGNWFCKHLSQARNNKFKENIKRIEKIIGLIISTIK